MVESGCEMACTCPMDAWKHPDGRIKFSPLNGAWQDRHIKVPCGQCIGCRLMRSQDWATRLAHEAQMHERTSFVTLTYSDDFLPDDFSVSVRELQLFMKRVRRRCGEVRFFACGEYGSAVGRPHYHLLLFGVDFAGDRKLWRVAPSGSPLYRSELLEKLWPFGHSEIGQVTAQSGGYVAKYVLKKVRGKDAPKHYERLHPITGVVCNVRPEFLIMSTRPGIGQAWFDKYHKDCFPSDFLVVDGRKVPVPKYYTKQLAEKEAFAVKIARKERAAKHASNNTERRLIVRHEVGQLKAARHTRALEEEL